MKNSKQVLDFILSSIYIENSWRVPMGMGLISSANSNEPLLSVFDEANRKFGIKLIDDEDFLAKSFGINGLHAIRNAEAGVA